MGASNDKPAKKDSVKSRRDADFAQSRLQEYLSQRKQADLAQSRREAELAQSRREAELAQSRLQEYLEQRRQAESRREARLAESKREVDLALSRSQEYLSQRRQAESRREARLAESRREAESAHSRLQEYLSQRRQADLAQSRIDANLAQSRRESDLAESRRDAQSRQQTDSAKSRQKVDCSLDEDYDALDWCEIELPKPPASVTLQSRLSSAHNSVDKRHQSHRSVAPISQNGAPISQTVAPISQTVASQTVAPISQTVAPISQTVAPISQTVAAINQTVPTHSGNTGYMQDLLQIGSNLGFLNTTVINTTCLNKYSSDYAQGGLTHKTGVSNATGSQYKSHSELNPSSSTHKPKASDATRSQYKSHSELYPSGSTHKPKASDATRSQYKSHSELYPRDSTHKPKASDATGSQYKSYGELYPSGSTHKAKASDATRTQYKSHSELYPRGSTHKPKASDATGSQYKSYRELYPSGSTHKPKASDATGSQYKSYRELYSSTTHQPKTLLIPEVGNTPHNQYGTSSVEIQVPNKCNDEEVSQTSLEVQVPNKCNDEEVSQTSPEVQVPNKCNDEEVSQASLEVQIANKCHEVSQTSLQEKKNSMQVITRRMQPDSELTSSLQLGAEVSKVKVDPDIDQNYDVPKPSWNDEADPNIDQKYDLPRPSWNDVNDDKVNEELDEKNDAHCRRTRNHVENVCSTMQMNDLAQVLNDQHLKQLDQVNAKINIDKNYIAKSLCIYDKNLEKDVDRKKVYNTSSNLDNIHKENTDSVREPCVNILKQSGSHELGYLLDPNIIHSGELNQAFEKLGSHYDQVTSNRKNKDDPNESNRLGSELSYKSSKYESGKKFGSLKIKNDMNTLCKSKNCAQGNTNTSNSSQTGNDENNDIKKGTNNSSSKPKDDNNILSPRYSLGDDKITPLNQPKKKDPKKKDPKKIIQNDILKKDVKSSSKFSEKNDHTSNNVSKYKTRSNNNLLEKRTKDTSKHDKALKGKFSGVNHNKIEGKKRTVSDPGKFRAETRTKNIKIQPDVTAKSNREENQEGGFNMKSRTYDPTIQMETCDLEQKNGQTVTLEKITKYKTIENSSSNRITNANKYQKSLTDDKNIASSSGQKVSLVLYNQCTKFPEVIKNYIPHLIPQKFSYEIINIDTENLQDVFVTVNFLTKTQAKQAITAINKNFMSTNAKACLQESSQTMIGEEIMDYLNQQANDIDERAKEAIAKHQLIMNETEKKIQQLQIMRHVPLDRYEIIRCERKTHEDKWKELMSQKEEFLNYTSKIKTRMLSLNNHNRSKMRNAAVLLKQEFKNECKKLSLVLPIYAKRRDILEFVNNNPVSIVLGETGSGKSTQMVQYIYQAPALGYTNFKEGMIVCTQPRKVAAQSLATHVSHEMGTSCGDIVGFKVGMNTKCGKNTKIVFATDHVLLNECLKDPTLEKYSCIIIDEAHERSIFTDLLLGMIKKCLVQRNDLKVIVTSATIDPDVFVNYFGGAPVLKISGRMFPVDVVWKKPNEPQKEDYLLEAINAVKFVHSNEPDGDVLVFLTTPLETQKACDRLNDTPLRNVLVCLPLHGQLQTQEQQRVFEPVARGKRKVVFATNSAETSITIPGIKYVIDTGLAKEKTFDAKRNMGVLIVTTISKSSAKQRMGRAGRTSTGKCYRLYTEETFQKMNAISQPEILRVHLGQALLKLMELGINDPLSFDFVQPPPSDALFSAIQVLQELGAVNSTGITDVGRKMAKMSIEPRMSKVILDAIDADIALEGIIVAAVCSIPGGVFYRMGTEEEKKMADKLKTRFCQEEGDLHTYMYVYKQWDLIPEKERSPWCFENYVNGKSMRMIRERVHEIRKILQTELKINIKYEFTDEKEGLLNPILLNSFKSNLAYFTGHEKAGYFVAKELSRKCLALHPSSALSYLGQPPTWVVYLDILKTSKEYMMCVVSLNSEMIEERIETGEIPIDVKILEASRLERNVAAEVGSSVMYSLTGQRYETMKSTELAFSLRYNAPIIIEANREKGQVISYTPSHAVKPVKDYILDTVKEAKLKLLEEYRELPILQNSNVRTVIECGAVTKMILMQDETRSVLLRNVDWDWTKEDVEDEFEMYGQIMDIISFNGKTGGKSPAWGKIIFKDPTAVMQTIRFYRGEIKVSPEGINRSRAATNEFRVKISWCRRPTRGFALVRPANREPLEITSSLRYVKIGECNASLSVCRNDPGKLFINRLTSNVTEEDLKGALSDHFQITEAFMPRTNVGETQPAKLQALTGQLSMLVDTFADRKEFQVIIFKPTQKSFDYRGLVIFNNPAIGLEVCDELDGITFDGEKLVAHADLRASISIQKDVHAVLKCNLQTTIQRLSKVHRATRITTKQLKNGSFAIDIESDDIDTMSAVREELQKVTQGHQVQCDTSESRQHLFSHAGKELLKSLESKYPVLVKIDNRLKAVTIFGEYQNIRIALGKIDTFLQQMHSMHNKEICLKGEDKPRGLMKYLLKEHGLELETLRQESGVSILTLILQRHILKVIGTNESLEKLTELVAAAARTLEQNPQKVDMDDIDCSVCFCPIDGSIYRLEYCGHPYCSECIVNLLKNGINNKEFPIQCAVEGCLKPVVWRDLNTWLGSGTMNDLVKSSVEFFVSQNEEKYKFCGSPDCPMLYRIASEDNEGTAFHCIGCGVTICTKCHKQFHTGLTCAMYKSKKASKDYDLKDWMEQDPNNRALCGKCKSPIEKNGGCRHVHCWKCKIHICWKCKALFPTEREAYDHLSDVCGGIFD